MIMIYNVTYYRQDKKTTETKSVVNVESMCSAVETIVNRAKKAGVKISQISCMVNNSHGIQKFCDICLLNEAIYGFKDNINTCKECKNG
jgi:hypothetical protein